VTADASRGMEERRPDIVVFDVRETGQDLRAGRAVRHHLDDVDHPHAGRRIRGRPPTIPSSATM